MTDIEFYLLISVFYNMVHNFQFKIKLCCSGWERRWGGMGNSKYRGNHNHNISHYSKIKKMKVYCVPYSGKNIAAEWI